MTTTSALRPPAMAAVAAPSGDRARQRLGARERSKRHRGVLFLPLFLLRPSSMRFRGVRDLGGSRSASFPPREGPRTACRSLRTVRGSLRHSGPPFDEPASRIYPARPARNRRPQVSSATPRTARSIRSRSRSLQLVRARSRFRRAAPRSIVAAGVEAVEDAKVDVGPAAYRPRCFRAPPRPSLTTSLAIRLRRGLRRLHRRPSAASTYGREHGRVPGSEVLGGVLVARRAPSGTALTSSERTSTQRFPSR